MKTTMTYIYYYVLSVPLPKKKRCCDPINIFGVLVVFNLNCLFIYIYLMKKSLLLYRGNN